MREGAIEARVRARAEERALTLHTAALAQVTSGDGGASAVFGTPHSAGSPTGSIRRTNGPPLAGAGSATGHAGSKEDSEEHAVGHGASDKPTQPSEKKEVGVDLVTRIRLAVLLDCGLYGMAHTHHPANKHLESALHMHGISDQTMSQYTNVREGQCLGLRVLCTRRPLALNRSCPCDWLVSRRTFGEW